MPARVPSPVTDAEDRGGRVEGPLRLGQMFDARLQAFDRVLVAVEVALLVVVQVAVLVRAPLGDEGCFRVRVVELRAEIREQGVH